MSTDNSPDINNFWRALKPAVCIGNALGLRLHHTGDVDVGIKGKSFKHRVFHVALLIYSISVFLFVIFNVLLLTKEYIESFDGHESNILASVITCTTIFHGSSKVIIYGYHMFGVNRFQKLIDKYCVLFDGTGTRKHSHFVKFCWLTTIFYIIQSFGEDILYQVLNSGAQNRIQWGSSTNDTESCRGYICSHITLSKDDIDITSHRFMLLAISMAMGRLVNVGKAFVHIFTIILCEAISLGFENLGEAISKKLSQLPTGPSDSPEVLVAKCQGELNEILEVKPEESASSMSKELSLTWDGVVTEFIMLADLTLETQRYIGPLLMCCYGWIVFILVSLFSWFAPELPFTIPSSATYYYYFSSVNYCLRIGIITYFVSKVHHTSQGLLGRLERCPGAAYSLEAQRMETKLNGNPVGIRLFETFLITRHFFLSIISFIFATEIILLQMANMVIRSS